MSEEILQALIQLFAIIAKQDEGVEHNEIAYVESFLTSQLSEKAAQEYLELFNNKQVLSATKVITRQNDCGGNDR